MVQLLVTGFLLLREAGPMAPERFIANLPTMSRIMEKLAGQIKLARSDAILFFSNIIRLDLHINPCKHIGYLAVVSSRPAHRRML